MERAELEVVGRRREVELVEAFLGDAGERAAALTVAGPAGIGKTTVWRAGVAAAQAGGWRVLVARPTGAEASLSFAGLADLLGAVDEALLDELPAPQRRALAAAFLREEPGEGGVDPRGVATATLNVLRELAAVEPTLVAVDDAQWLDKATADCLAFAVRRLIDVPLAALVSVRTGGVRPQTFETTLPEERREELGLTPLTLAAMHEVIRARLGRALARPTLVRILERSGGNVFYALEIARELVDRHGEDAASLAVPTSVQELIRARVGRLPHATREALLLASALASPTTAVVAAEELAPAEEAGIVRIEVDGRVRFEHPLLAAAIYESASLESRRDAHRRLVQRSEDAEERARHLALAAGEPDEAVASELDAAARHTAARGASAAAAELARYAVDATPAAASEARARRTITLAHHLLDAGESAAARAALEACDPSPLEGDVRAELLRQLGWTLWFERDFERGYALLVEALEHVRDPQIAARIHSDAAWLSQDVDLERAIAHDDAAVALLDPDETPGLYSRSLLHGTYLRLLNGEGADAVAYRRGRDLQERGVAWDDNSPVLGMWPVLHDDFVLARAFYEPGLEWSRAEGDEPSVQGTLVRLAEMACWTGDWADADRLATEGMQLADRVGSSAYLGSALYARGLLDAHLGRVDDARAAGQRIVELFQGNETQAVLGHWVLGFVALSLGDAATADEQYGRAAAIVEALGQREPARFRFHPDQLEAVAELGDLVRARELLVALDARAAVFPRPWILATRARCRALVLAAEGDLAGARAAAAAALSHHEQLEMPFERARTVLVHGTILRRLKQKREARAALEEAAAVFTRLGASIWAARADAELRRVATRSAPGVLTPTERRIAELAAAGLSNPEIAARVYVSRKTVEANLARVYRKLGISSRAQLGRSLDREPGAIS